MTSLSATYSSKMTTAASHRRSIIPPLLLAVLLTAPLVFGSRSVHAQENTFHQVGIAGKDDSKGRSPELFVRTVVLEDRVQILADAQQRNSDLQPFPIRFDFFINRRLFSSQVRSPELPGPIGVDIGADIASPPFNYLVVATTLTPNGRPFTTALPGAVFASNLLAKFDCTVLLGGENGDEYIENDLTSSQSGNSSFALSFQAESLSGTSTLTFSGDFAVVNDSEVAGTATYVSDLDGAVPVTTELSGSATFVNSSSRELNSLSLASDDGQVQLRCS